MRGVRGHGAMWRESAHGEGLGWPAIVREHDCDQPDTGSAAPGPLAPRYLPGATPPPPPPVHGGWAGRYWGSSLRRARSTPPGGRTCRVAPPGLRLAPARRDLMVTTFWSRGDLIVRQPVQRGGPKRCAAPKAKSAPTVIMNALSSAESDRMASHGAAPSALCAPSILRADLNSRVVSKPYPKRSGEKRNRSRKTA